MAVPLLFAPPLECVRLHASPHMPRSRIQKKPDLSGPVLDTPPCRAIPFRYSIADGVSHLFFRDRKGTPKNFCDKDFAELSGELSGAICLKTLVLMGNDQ